MLWNQYACISRYINGDYVMTNMDIVTRGDNEKIAYLEMENLAVMRDNRVLANLILKQEKLIERLKRKAIEI